MLGCRSLEARNRLFLTAQLRVHRLDSLDLLEKRVFLVHQRIQLLHLPVEGTLLQQRAERLLLDGCCPTVTTLHSSKLLVIRLSLFQTLAASKLSHGLGSGFQLLTFVIRIRIDMNGGSSSRSDL